MDTGTYSNNNEYYMV